MTLLAPAAAGLMRSLKHTKKLRHAVWGESRRRYLLHWFVTECHRERTSRLLWKYLYAKLL